tara:strand:+ start:1600 stop:2100 length:501 start_codon:yes stop_codon:yes gene_type:complete
MADVKEVELEYDADVLIQYWEDNKDKATPLYDVVLPLNEGPKAFRGKTLWHVMKTFNKEIRQDMILDVSKDWAFENVTWQIPYDIGRVTFFWQAKGEDVPLHTDIPYRNKSIVLIPLYGEGTTYYENGDDYILTGPTILNVTKKHGVKNIKSDRLSLHVELLNYNE